MDLKLFAEEVENDGNYNIFSESKDCSEADAVKKLTPKQKAAWLNAKKKGVSFEDFLKKTVKSGGKPQRSDDPIGFKSGFDKNKE